MTSAVRSRPARFVAAAALAVAVALLAWLAYGWIRGTGGPPADAAQRLVPADALVVLDVSTDTGRRAVRQLVGVADDLDAYDRLTGQLLERLSGSGGGLDPDEDVLPWLGDQATLALTDSGTGTAASLVVAEVTDAGAARRFLSRNQQPSVRRTYKDVRVDRYGAISTAIADEHLLIGPDITVQAAIDLAQGRGEALAGDATYRRAVADLPDGRAVTAYATDEGLDRLLIPQGGVLGTLAGLLDRPGLRAAALSLQAEDGDVRAVAHSVLDARAGRTTEAFVPTLQREIPADAIAAVVQRGDGATLRRAFETAFAGTGSAGARVLERVRREPGLRRLLEGEVALVVTRAGGLVPTATLVARTPDEAGARRTLERLRLPTGGGLSYEVADGKLLLSTSREGIAAVRDPERALAGADAFDAVLDDRPERVGSLGFIDFRQLLDLGEQTGLNDDRSYLAARDDLRRIGAVGFSSTGSEGEATAEILVSIP